MKTLYRFTLLIAIMSVIFIACDSKPERPESVQSTSATPASATSADFTAGNIPPGTTTTTATPPAGGAQNASGEYHYNCPKGCEGGAAGAGKCASCGGDLVHNQAFHGAPAATPTSTTTTTATTPQFNVTGVDGATQIQTPPAAASAQNASGEFHYTCPKGCAGGGAGAGKCAGCGGDLAHNQAFHNK